MGSLGQGVGMHEVAPALPAGDGPEQVTGWASATAWASSRLRRVHRLCCAGGSWSGRRLAFPCCCLELHSLPAAGAPCCLSSSQVLSRQSRTQKEAPGYLTVSLSLPFASTCLKVTAST